MLAETMLYDIFLSILDEEGIMTKLPKKGDLLIENGEE